MISARLWAVAAALVLAASARAAGDAEYAHVLRYLESLGEAEHPPEPTLYEGLPAELPADFLERERFLSFEELPQSEARRMRAPRPYALAPIAASLKVDGEAIDPMDRAAQRRIFEESVYAMIPPGTSIRVSGKPPRETWEYPVGTTVAHRIGLRSLPPRVFELRIARKVAAGRWAFGSYSPRDVDDPAPASALHLNTYPGHPPSAFTARLAESGPSSRIELVRIRLSTCQGCHFANSTADYQYERRREDGSLDVWGSIGATGPCGFVPNNPGAREGWARAFALANGGRSPFE
ncbi:MAG: hypothetical protein HY078_01105 [Elusimicrobia bacterium]|nr:hypothetical protein [Elusimicrobiota bacterium]